MVSYILFLGAVAFSGAHFGQGVGPIQMGNVGCFGNESALIQCAHSTISNCVHADDAGIRCNPPGIHDCTC